MEKNELTPEQKRLIIKVSLSNHFWLSDEEAIELLNLPHDIMREQLVKYIDTRRSLPDKVVVQIFRRYQEFGEDILKLCIKNPCEVSNAVQMEIFNLPAELRDELLLILAKDTRGSKRFCSEAILRILDLPQKAMMEIISAYLNCGNGLPKDAQLKVMLFGQDVAEEIFSINNHLPEPDVFDVVFDEWDAAARKKFFLANIEKIYDFELKHYYERLERIVDLILKFPANDRDELLAAFFDRDCLDMNIFKKICTIDDPSRKQLLMRMTYSMDGIDVLLELPEPTRTDILIHQIEESDYCNFTSQQVKKFFGFPEPYRSRLLRAYAKEYNNLFGYAKNEVLEMPEPLRTELVLNSLVRSVSKDLFELPEPLKTKALCAYFSTKEAEDNDLLKVFDLPDESRKTVLLAAIEAKANMYLFDYVNSWLSPLKKKLFELPEPSRSEVVKAYVENGWELDEPWMLWLLSKEVRDPLIVVYAEKHKNFRPSYYEEKVKKLFGEIPA